MHTGKDQLQRLKPIKKRSEFVAMNQKARKWVSHGLVIQVMQNGLDEMRVGYTVTKKTEKSAVKRNRIKRRLRAVAADVLSIYGQDGYDYVLIGRNQTAIRPYDQLVADLKWCLGKMKMLKNGAP